MTDVPQKVLITTDAVGGIWTYSLDLAQGLRARGIQPVVAVIGPEADAQQQAACAALGVKLLHANVPLDWWGVGRREIRASGRRLAAIAKSINADLIHIHAPSLAADVEFDMPVIGSCHSCLSTWWSAVKQEPMPDEFVWRSALLTDGYRACDRLIAPSRSFALATEAVHGVSPRVVHNGRREPLRGPLQQRAGVLTAGRLWDAGKNVAVLDRAAARMRMPAAAAGALTGPHGETIELQNLASLGQIDAATLAHRLDGAAIFASLSLYEPFGLSVLEAAQAGCALVLSDIPTFRELWEGAAEFVSPHDDRQLALLLDRIGADPAQRDAMGRRARKRAGSYGLNGFVEATLAIYAEAVGVRAKEFAA